MLREPLSCFTATLPPYFHPLSPRPPTRRAQTFFSFFSFFFSFHAEHVVYDRHWAHRVPYFEIVFWKRLVFRNSAHATKSRFIKAQHRLRTNRFTPERTAPGISRLSSRDRPPNFVLLLPRFGPGALGGRQPRFRGVCLCRNVLTTKISAVPSLPLSSVPESLLLLLRCRY